MRATFLLLSTDADTVTYVRRVLESAAPAAVLDVSTSPVQLRHRLSSDRSCLAVAIDDRTVGTALTPLVRHLRAEAPNVRVALVAELVTEEVRARGVLAGVDRIVPRDENGTAHLSALLSGGNESHADVSPPLRVVACSVSRQLLTAIEKRPSLSATTVSGEDVLNDPQLLQTADAMILAATIPDEAALLLQRLRTSVAALPVVVLCDEQLGAGFLRLGAAECLPVAADLDAVALAVTRAVERARLLSEAAAVTGREKRLRALVESLPAGVVLTAPDGMVHAINRAAIDQCQLDGPAAALGKPLSTLFGDRNQQVIAAIVAGIRDGRRVDVGIVVDHDGRASEPIRFELRALPYEREAGQPSFVLLALDVVPAISYSRAEMPADDRTLSLADERDRERASRLATEEDRDRLRRCVDELEARCVHAEQEVERLRSLETVMADGAGRQEPPDADHSDELRAARQDIDALRQAHAAACVAYISGRRAQAALEQEAGALRTQLDDARAAMAHAMAEADAARQSRDEWERRAQAALAQRASEDVRQQHPDAWHPGLAGEHEWLLGAATVGMITTTRDGRFERCNDVAAQACGWPDAVAAMIHGRMPEALFALEDRCTTQQPMRFESWLQGIDGAVRRVLGVVRVIPSPAGGGSRVEWRLVDLGHEQPRVAAGSNRRPETLIHLLASTTGECIALLGVVGQALDRVGEDVSSPTSDAPFDPARMALQRTQLVLKQLSASIHHSGRRAVVVDLGAALLDAAPLLKQLAGEQVACEIGPAFPGLFVLAEDSELEQLLTALVLSGCEGLASGGRIALAAMPCNSEAIREGEMVLRPGVLLRLSASGTLARAVVWQQACDLATRIGGRIETRQEGHNRAIIDVELPLVLRLNEAPLRAASRSHPSASGEPTVAVRAARAVSPRIREAL